MCTSSSTTREKFSVTMHPCGYGEIHFFSQRQDNWPRIFVRQNGLFALRIQRHSTLHVDPIAVSVQGIVAIQANLLKHGTIYGLEFYLWLFVHPQDWRLDKLPPALEPLRLSAIATKHSSVTKHSLYDPPGHITARVSLSHTSLIW